MLNTDKTEASWWCSYNIHSRRCRRNPHFQGSFPVLELWLCITLHYHSLPGKWTVPVNVSCTTVAQLHVCEESELTALRNVIVHWSLKLNAQCNALNSKTLGQQCAPCLLVVAQRVCFNTVTMGKFHYLLEVFRILNSYRMSSRSDFITFKAWKCGWDVNSMSQMGYDWWFSTWMKVPAQWTSQLHFNQNKSNFQLLMHSQNTNIMSRTDYITLQDPLWPPYISLPYITCKPLGLHKKFIKGRGNQAEGIVEEDVIF